MAGHSKWANIKHKKQKEDKRRGKMFSKLSRRITVAARKGGGDPEFNPTLRMEIDRAKEQNMPNDNIERAIKRGTGELEGTNFEDIVYEGYGPAGVALYIELLTDNRNRTASEIRRLLDDHGGNLGENGCVAWLFERKGLININSKELNYDEEELMLLAIECGADDVVFDDESIEIITQPEDFAQVKSQLEQENIEIAESKITRIPSNTVKLERNDAKRILKLMDKLEDHDDVQDVYANFDISDDVLEELEE